MKLGILAPNLVIPACRIVNICSNQNEIFLLSDDGKYTIIDFVNISPKMINEIAFNFKRSTYRRKKLKTISELFTSRGLESQDYEIYGKYVKDFFYGEVTRSRARFSSSEFPVEEENEEYGKLHDSSLVHQFRTNLSELF